MNARTAAALYGSLQRVLNVVDSLPTATARRGVWRAGVESRGIAVAGTAAALELPFAVAMGGGRYGGGRAAGGGLRGGPILPAAAAQPGPCEMAMASADPQAGERILLVAVGDYLERSQMVLVELANANPKTSMDISSEQERASDLVSESRLYRQTALHTGNAAVASVLDDLDRVLLEISHAPSRISPEELEKLRQRLEAEGILFKIRVLGSNVRNQEEPAASTVRQKL